MDLFIYIYIYICLIFLNRDLCLQFWLIVSNYCHIIQLWLFGLLTQFCQFNVTINNCHIKKRGLSNYKARFILPIDWKMSLPFPEYGSFFHCIRWLISFEYWNLYQHSLFEVFLLAWMTSFKVCISMPITNLFSIFI